MIARTWKQPKCSSTKERVKTMRYIHTIELYYPVIRNNAIVPSAEMWADWDCHTEWSELEREKQISYNITYLCRIQKNDTDELNLQSTNKDTNIENKHMDTKGQRRGGMNWETGIDIYRPLCIKWITNENPPYQHGELNSVLWRTGRDGNLKKKEVSVCV